MKGRVGNVSEGNYSGVRNMLRTTFQKLRNPAKQLASLLGGNGNEILEADHLESSELPLVAYRTAFGGPRLRVASAKRKWMDDTCDAFAGRWLPLLIANQAGWFVLNDRKIEAVWNGGDSPSDLCIRYYKERSAERISRDDVFAVSHFGFGVLTWHIPFLFRTAPGYNLYVRGPSNWCKDGACPLDGIVETDWTASTLSMNWKITRIATPISFAKDEPICMFFPLRRGDTDRVRPEMRRLNQAPELKRRHDNWSKSRRLSDAAQFQARSKEQEQKGYLQERSTNDFVFRVHQTRLKVRDFEDYTEF